MTTEEKLAKIKEVVEETEFAVKMSTAAKQLKIAKDALKNQGFSDAFIEDFLLQIAAGHHE